jgi:hypothetical protein
MAKATKQHTPPAMEKTNTPPARKQARKQDMSPSIFYNLVQLLSPSVVYNL